MADEDEVWLRGKGGRGGFPTGLVGNTDPDEVKDKYGGMGPPPVGIDNT